MKKAFIILLIGTVITACGGNSKQGNNAGADSTQAANQTAAATNSNADTNAAKIGTEAAGSSPGESLMATADCGTCHKVDSKVIGPSFQDVAAKYPATDANITLLANKVINGGSGNWGDVPMTPHPALALNDAKTMVKYILSLKK